MLVTAGLDGHVYGGDCLTVVHHDTINDVNFAGDGKGKVCKSILEPPASYIFIYLDLQYPFLCFPLSLLSRTKMKVIKGEKKASILFGDRFPAWPVDLHSIIG